MQFHGNWLKAPPPGLYEIKFDGFRGLAYVFGGRCQLMSRKGHIHRSPLFDRLCTAIATGIKAKNAVLDGEICALGSDGRSIFTDLLEFPQSALTSADGEPSHNATRRIRLRLPREQGPLIEWLLV